MGMMSVHFKKVRSNVDGDECTPVYDECTHGYRQTADAGSPDVHD